MGEIELKQAIQKPLQQRYPNGERKFETALLDKIVADMHGDPTYLPLLQVTLEELWRKGSLILASYSGIADAITRQAEKVYSFKDFNAPMPSHQRSESECIAITEIFLNLVNVSLDGDIRRDFRVSRLKHILVQSVPQATNSSVNIGHLIEELTSARLLMITNDSMEEGTERVNIIHETIIMNWLRLQNSIQVQRERLQQRVRFEQQVSDWISHDKNKVYLLSGVYLAQALELDRLGDISLQNSQARDLLSRSIELADLEQQRQLDQERHQTILARRSRNRQRFLSVVLAIALIASIGLGLFAIRKQFEAEKSALISMVREWRSAADLIKEKYPLAAMRLQTEALAHILDFDDAEKNVQVKSLSEIFSSGIVQTYDGEWLPLPFSHYRNSDMDKTRKGIGYVIVQSDNTADTGLLINAGTGELIRRLPRRIFLESSFSQNWIDPKGTIFIANYGEYDNSLSEIFILNTGKIIKLNNDISSVDFNRDDSVFFIKYGSGASELRRTETGELIKSIDGGYDGSFNSNGDLLIVGSSYSLKEIYSTDTGQLISFPEKPLDIWTDPTDAFFIVDYDYNTTVASEIRRVKTNEVVAKLYSEIYQVHFSPNGKIFEIEYGGPNHPLNELRYTDTGKVAELSGTPHSVIFSHKGEQFVVGYENGKPSELRNTSDNKLVKTLPTSEFSDISFSPTDEILIWSPHAEGQSLMLFHSDTGDQIRFPASDAFIDFSPKGDTFILNYFNPVSQTKVLSSELRFVDSDVVIQLAGDLVSIGDLSDGASGPVFSPNSDAIILNYEENIPSEILYIKTNHAVKLPDKAHYVYFSLSNDKFLIDYVNNRNTEIRNSRTGEVIGQVNFPDNPNQAETPSRIKDIRENPSNDTFIVLDDFSRALLLKNWSNPIVIANFSRIEELEWDTTGRTVWLKQFSSSSSPQKHIEQIDIDTLLRLYDNEPHSPEEWIKFACGYPLQLRALNEEESRLLRNTMRNEAFRACNN